MKAEEFVLKARQAELRARRDHANIVRQVKAPEHIPPLAEINYTKETAALRRASMDLTRVLSALRKP
jgi:hypothetical protein